MRILAVLLAASCASCASPQVAVQDVTIGLNAALCVLRTYSTDVQNGMGEAAAAGDSAIKCGISAAQASGILAEHKAAQQRMGLCK